MKKVKTGIWVAIVVFVFILVYIVIFSAEVECWNSTVANVFFVWTVRTCAYKIHFRERSNDEIKFTKLLGYPDLRIPAEGLERRPGVEGNHTRETGCDKHWMPVLTE